MPDSNRHLPQLQRWLQEVITNAAGIEAGVESPNARGEIDVSLKDLQQVVTRSNALTSVERLAVYGNAYFARLLECMRAMFPVLCETLGEELFDGFALDYLKSTPSQSYTLDRLADRFVPYLEQTRPQAEPASVEDPPGRTSDGATEPSWPDFIIDLARLECAIAEVFDAPGVEGQPLLTAEQITAVPADAWSEAQLKPVVCLRLLSFRFPVNDFYTAHRNGETPAIPAPAATHLALSRRDFVVHRYPLSDDQAVLLQALVDGESVGEAIEKCAESCSDVDELAGQLSGWFEEWAAEQLFEGVVLAEASH